MEHLMNELVGRSLARQRERDLAQSLRSRRAEAQRTAPAGRPRPRRRRPLGGAPVVAHA